MSEQVATRKIIRSLTGLVVSTCLAVHGHAQTVDDYVEMIQGCRSGNLQVVKAALAKGIHIDQPDGNSWTPLCHALDLSQEEVARYLISKGASVNLGITKPRYPDFRQYPINYAIMACSTDMVRALLDRGARPDHSINSHHVEGQSPVAVALAYHKLEALKELQARGVSLKSWQYMGHNALSMAAYHENVPAIEYLLALRADPNQPNPEGNSPISVAAYTGRVEVVRALLKGGATPNLISKGAPNIKGYGAMPHTALIGAVRSNSLPVVQLLLDSGADPKALNSQAIQYADLAGNQAIHDLLLAHGGEKQGPYSFLQIDGIQPQWVTHPERAIRSKSVDWGLTTVLNRKTPKAGHPSSPVKLTVAVLPLEAELDPVESLLIARLSKLPSVQVVERSQIREIAAEQSLNAVSLSRSETVYQFGQLLGADALILLVQHEDLSEARLVSTSTGLVIGSIYAKKGKDPQGWTGEIANLLATNGELLSLEPNKWILISIPKIKASRSRLESLEAEAQFNKALALHLGAQENVFILERDEMQRLAFEKSLKDELRQFYGSGWIVDGNLELGATESGAIKVQIRMRAGKGQETNIEETGNLSDIQGLLSRLTAQLVSHVSKSPMVPYAASKEAQIYFQEAKDAFAQNNWDLAHRSAEAAWALGRQDNTVLNMRIHSMVERIKNSRSIIDVRKIGKLSGDQQLLALRAPLLLPKIDPRELSAREYIELAESLLAIYEQLSQKQGSYTELERRLIFNYPYALTGIQAPLELMHSLSDESLHADALESIRQRARAVTRKLMDVCKQHDEAQSYCSILGMYLINLPYWERNEDHLCKEIVQRLDEVMAITPPYSHHSIFEILKDELGKQMSHSAGQAITAWQRVARILLDHPRLDAQLLGHYLVLKNSGKPFDEEYHGMRMHELSRDILVSDKSVLGVTITLRDFQERPYSKLPNGAGYRPWHGPFDASPHFNSAMHVHDKFWRPPLRLKVQEQGRGNPTQCQQHALLYQYYSSLWFKKFAATGAYARPQWCEINLPVGNHAQLQACLERGREILNKRIERYPYVKDRIQKDFETYYLKPLNQLVHAGPEPVGHASDVSEFVCNGMMSPFFLNDAPFTAETKGRNHEQHALSYFNKVRDEVWVGMRQWGFMRMLPDKTVGEMVTVPKDSRFYGTSRNLNNARFVDRDSIAVWFIRFSGKAESCLGIYDRKKMAWKRFPLDHLPAPVSDRMENGYGVHDIVVLKKHVYFSYLFNPNSDSFRNGNGLVNDSNTQMGISRIDLDSGKEELLVSNRRSPALSPLDKVKGHYYELRKIGESQFLCGNHVWQEDQNQWRQATEKEKRMWREESHSVRFGTHRPRKSEITHNNHSLDYPSLRLTRRRPIIDSETGKVSYEFESKVLPVRAADWSKIKVPKEWTYMAGWKGRSEPMKRFVVDVDEGGVILSTPIGFYYCTPDEMATLLDRLFGPDDTDYTKYDETNWMYGPVDE